MTYLWLILLIVGLIFGLVAFRGAPYVPSRKKYIKQALTELYPLSDKDMLVDIGSGDGIVLREAAKTGAKAIGYEINPILVLISRFISRNNELIVVRLADFWLSHIPKGTTVIYVFSVTRDMNKILKWVQNETNQLGTTIYLITYGSGIKGGESIKNVGAYNLYVFYPLQLGKA